MREKVGRDNIRVRGIRAYNVPDELFVPVHRVTGDVVLLLDGRQEVDASDVEEDYVRLFQRVSERQGEPSSEQGFDALSVPAFVVEFPFQSWVTVL